MNSAIPIDSGSAIASARMAAHTVPNTSGATYSQKLEGAVGSSAGSTTRAGILCTIRNTDTAPSAARISTPATTVLDAKIRSAGRDGTFAPTTFWREAFVFTGFFGEDVVSVGASLIGSSRLRKGPRQRASQKAV